MLSPKQCLLERTAKDLPLPARQSLQAAGFDLHANITEQVIIKKGEYVLIPAGIKIALPFGYEAQLRSRSGLALKHGVAVLNSPGTVDADYRGEIKVLLINHGAEDFTISRGDRIAQMIIAKVEMVDFIETDDLPESCRGEDGYGSTGTRCGARCALPISEEQSTL
jgi:dUTP pyrophosphatase